MAASDNDVYTKSTDENNCIAAKSRSDMDAISVNGPAAWSTTFEKLLADPAGLHTFSVSLAFVYFMIQVCYNRDLANECTCDVASDLQEVVGFGRPCYEKSSKQQSVFVLLLSRDSRRTNLLSYNLIVTFTIHWLGMHDPRSKKFFDKLSSGRKLAA